MMSQKKALIWGSDYDLFGDARKWGYPAVTDPILFAARAQNARLGANPSAFAGRLGLACVRMRMRQNCQA
jgi:hypothetical protein